MIAPTPAPARTFEDAELRLEQAVAAEQHFRQAAEEAHSLRDFLTAEALSYLADSHHAIAEFLRAELRRISSHSLTGGGLETTGDPITQKQ